MPANTMRLTKELYSKRYYGLLASIVSLTVLAPIIEHGFWARMLVGTLMFVTLWTASVAVSNRSSMDAKTLVLAGAAGALWGLGFFAEMMPFDPLYLHYLTYAVILFFFANVGRIMLEDILQGEMTSNRICGGVCVFILLGLCFAMLHMMVAAGDPNAYRDSTNLVKHGNEILSREYNYPLFTYFSFCTLSTVGYGDMVPISRLARSCSMIEAVTGQLYLAILVARLVGLHVATRAAVDRAFLEESKSRERQLEVSGRR